ncbi:unnamed protein product [Amoebophrya sp. A120]|nr:unnamed protein product [Amoebophrya sp. A120]|eukprot:GSA120T00006302001.1
MPRGAAKTAATCILPESAPLKDQAWDCPDAAKFEADVKKAREKAERGDPSLGRPSATHCGEWQKHLEAMASMLQDTRRLVRRKIDLIPSGNPKALAEQTKSAQLVGGSSIGLALAFLAMDERDERAREGSARTTPDGEKSRDCREGSNTVGIRERSAKKPLCLQLSGKRKAVKTTGSDRKETTSRHNSRCQQDKVILRERAPARTSRRDAAARTESSRHDVGIMPVVLEKSMTSCLVAERENPQSGSQLPGPKNTPPGSAAEFL